MISIFKKVESEDFDQQFRIHIQFNEHNFTLLILEKSNAWKAEVSWNEITKLSDQFNLNAEAYYFTFKQYVEDTPVNVELKFTNKEFVCYCRENGIKLKYFSCKLKKVGFDEHVCDLLDTFSSENKKLKQQNAEILKEAVELRKGHKQLEAKLIELVERKTKEEQELLSNFVLVVNEKKRRIQHLNQTLHAFKAGRPVLNPQIKLRKNPQKEIKKESNNVSESDSSSDNEGYNTDEEKLLKKSEEIPEEVLPSTSKKQDEDLFLSDSEDEIDLPKRIKVKDDREDLPDTSSTLHVQNKNRESEVTTDVDMKADSPKISFNTQDLLDCIE